MESKANDITHLLAAIREGDLTASRQLLPLVYDELRSLAAGKMAHLPAGQTLQPTALVHEVYVRLIDSHAAGWETRRHFFAAAGQAMRNILVEQARRKSRLKRGGGKGQVPLDQIAPAIDPPNVNMLALDEALRRLEELDKTKCEVVMLRFFAGLTIEDTARALDVSRATADRYWSYARAWLRREITKGDSDSALAISNE